MENFVVSARKYRPQNFETVVGQSHITTTLKNAIKNNQLAHAFLFCGPRGVGKTTCARILAKTINCENRTADAEACNTCNSCKAFNEGQSFNIHELDAASNNSVDDIRALTDQVRFMPQSGKYKVYIIDEVHMLSSQAFNAFLKTLEEPPAHAIFILATTEKHKILPTILSRCQVFDFKRMSVSDTVAHLQEIGHKEKIEAEADALHLIAQKSEGCMRDALSIMDKIISFTNGHLTYQNTLEHLNILDYEYFFRVMDALQQQDAGATLLILDEVLQKGFEGSDFIEGLSAFIRDLLVGKDKRVIHLMEVSDNLKARYEQLSQNTDTAFLVSALNLLNEADIQYRQARNKRLLTEMCLIRLSYLQQAVALISDGQTGAVSKKKVTGPPQKPQQLRPPLPLKVSKSGSPKVQPASTNVEAVPEKEKPAKKREEKKKPAEKKKIPVSENPFNASGKLDLTSVRNKVEKKNNELSAQEEKQVLPLEDEGVQQLWQELIAELKEKQKQQATANMEMATISVIGDHEALITCRNSLQKHFIEDEKINFAEKLKTHFHNPGIQVIVKVDESLRQQQHGPEILTQRQQLEEMMKKYPLVKKLKEGLNLDLG